MKRTIILSIALLCWLFGQAQSETTRERPFFHDEFRLGTVFFSEGNTVRAMLNYNFVSQEMQFLNHLENDAILDLVRQPNLTHVEIGDDVFVPVGRGFAHIIRGGPVMLLKRKHIDIVAGRGRGAYGSSTNTAAVRTPPYLIGGIGGATAANFTNLPLETEYRVRLHFYLMKNGSIYSATRRNFLRVYREVRPQLEAFMRDNTIDFSNERHLLGLTNFANSLLLTN